MFADRKSSYKLPPTTITDRLVSQEARRSKALEQQKRRRAQRVDSSRQLDQFADLNLGVSDEEDTVPPGGRDVTELSLASVAHYASMLDCEVSPSSVADHAVPPTSHSPKDGPKKTKKKRKTKSKPNKWADKCMYAELLEMTADDPWVENTDDIKNDGLPSNLETGWVAVGPVPVGKRCLAVTHQSSGIAGVVPNTTLRSRLLGKVLIQRFPSALPPLTVLDCILDSNWRENGILHVLDVVKWKGQDISDCESSFRFWWRDTRLTELAQSAPPAILQSDSQMQYHFPYPITFLPVPYYTDTTLPTLVTQIIPMARSVRSVAVNIPALLPPPSSAEGMDIDISFKYVKGPAPLVPFSANVTPDGLLLYVAEASYEAGTSPLSSWIPITGYEGLLTSSPSPLELFQRLVHRRLLRQTSQASNPEMTIEVDL